MYVQFHAAANHVVQTRRCDNSFHIFHTSKIGYTEKPAMPIDANRSGMAQVSVTGHSRRILLQKLLNSYVKQSKT